MPDLLDALGVRGARRRQLIAVSIWISFGLAMVGVAAGQAVIEDALDASTAAVCLTVATVWLGWTYWHSVAFERHRRAYLGRGMAFPYRRAFLTDIFPGITIGFSQMLRPAWNGVNLAADEVFPNPDLPADTLSLLTGVTLFALVFAVSQRPGGHLEQPASDSCESSTTVPTTSRYGGDRIATSVTRCSGRAWCSRGRWRSSRPRRSAS